MNESIDSVILAQLREIVALWPAHETILPKQMHDLVAKDFELVDLTNRVSAVVAPSRIESIGELASVEFRDADGTLQRAVFRQSTEDGKWRMRSLKFQCPVCFGTGSNDGDICIGCDGSGWGAA